MSFETMYPHIRGKRPKKIVSVTFEDGLTVPVDDEGDLRGYLAIWDARREDEAMAKEVGPLVAQLIEADRKADEEDRKIWVALQNRENAAQPRVAKEVTKAVLLEHRVAYECEHGSLYGWRKAAAAEFKLSEDQIDRRIAA